VNTPNLGLALPLSWLYFPFVGVVKDKITATAGFGAAMASVYTAPELLADIIDLNFNPGTVAYGLAAEVKVDIVGTTGGAVGAFRQWNDIRGKDFALNAPNDSLFASWKKVAAGDELMTATFVGINPFLSFGANATGTVYVGFKTKSKNVGWFGANLGGTGSSVTYTGGQFGSAYESVTVGATAVPEPSAFGLSLLALGVVGLRRRRAATN
jgi:hypothetical protein